LANFATIRIATEKHFYRAAMNDMVYHPLSEPA